MAVLQRPEEYPPRYDAVTMASEKNNTGFGIVIPFAERIASIASMMRVNTGPARNRVAGVFVFTCIPRKGHRVFAARRVGVLSVDYLRKGA
jgi:hypothetical protein